MDDLVIVIDDSRTICKIVEVALGRTGIRCISFPDGMTTLRTVQAQPELHPTVVLLDIQLPKIDGIALLRLFKQQPSFEMAAIIMLTRRDGVLDRLKARLAGASEYVTKPFQSEELVDVVRSYLLVPPLLEEFSVGKQVCVKKPHPFAGLCGVLNAQISEMVWEVDFPSLSATLPFPVEHLAHVSKRVHVS